MGKLGRGRTSVALRAIALSAAVVTLQACSGPAEETSGEAGAIAENRVKEKESVAKGLRDKPCIQVNANRGSGPYSLFDVPADMMEAEFIMAFRKENPKWTIYSEHAEPACDANVYVDVKGLSYSIDRVLSYDEVLTTLGVGAGMSIYVPAHSEQPFANVAVSDSVPGAANLLASALEQTVRASRSAKKQKSRAKPLEEGKFCYSLSAVSPERYEDLAQNIYYSSTKRLFTSPDGYKPSENCVPDFYVSRNEVEIRSSSGIEGRYGLLVLRESGAKGSRVYLTTGPGPTEVLVRNINEMSRVLGPLERNVAQKQAVNKNWSEEEITAVLELIVSTSVTYHSLTRSPEYDAETGRMRNHMSDGKQREEGARRYLQRSVDIRNQQQAEQQAAEAITKLRSIMLKDADKVRQVAARYERKLDKPQRQMMSDIVGAFTDIEVHRDGRSPFITDANMAWRKVY